MTFQTSAAAAANLLLLVAVRFVSAQFEDVVFIDPLACQGDGSCIGNVMFETDVGTYQNITGSESCNAAGACSSNIDWYTLWITNACSGENACNDNKNDLVIEGPKSCTGKGSCSYNTVGMSIEGDSCTGSLSCSTNSVRMVTFGSVCTGDNSCSQNVGTNGLDASDPDFVATTFSVGNNSCTGTGSCSTGLGVFFASEQCCTGAQSCQGWVVGSNTDGDNTPTSFYVNRGSCTGDNSCQGLVSDDFKGYISIGEGACTGTNSCQNIKVIEGSVELSIGPGACTEDNSCQSCTDGIIGAGCQTCGCSYSPSQPSGCTSPRSFGLSIMVAFVLSTVVAFAGLSW